MSKKEPPEFLQPPGNPLNPLLFVAPVFGEFHKLLVDFILPPAFVPLQPPIKEQSTVESKNVVNVHHSPSLGTCQPVGQIPFTFPEKAGLGDVVLLAPFWY
jgi:hypothetical protein